MKTMFEKKVDIGYIFVMLRTYVIGDTVMSVTSAYVTATAGSGPVNISAPNYNITVSDSLQRLLPYHTLMQSYK